MKFQLGRLLFFIGFTLSTALTFVPSYLMNPWIVGTTLPVSNFQLIRLLLQGNAYGYGMLYVLFFCIEGGFAVLSWTYPRRIIFILGACFAIFFMILDLFQENSSVAEYLPIPRFLGYVCFVLKMSGFWVKPQIEVKNHASTI